MSSFTPQRHLSGLCSLHCHSSPAAPTLIFITFPLFLSLYFQRSQLWLTSSHPCGPSFSCTVPHGVTLPSPLLGACASPQCCVSLPVFLWHNVSQFLIFLCIDLHSLSSPRPLFIPLSSLGLWLAASLLNLVLWETPVLVSPSSACTAGSSAACHYPA